MKTEIKILDEKTINKIAAGEVIENPASVAKELIENAVDAGASEIVVETKGGGLSLIRIIDDGTGIAHDQLPLAPTRYATSKIRTIDDLNVLQTMGFRGEALSSIAAVSRFSIHTATQVSSLGHVLECNGGGQATMHHATRARGTTVEVRELFFNVPARLKFQKSPAHETQEIAKVLYEAVLAYPEVTFQWIHEQDERLHISGKDTLQMRLEKLFGQEYVHSFFSFSFDEPGFALKGFLSLPAFSKKNRKEQRLFLNRRIITSSLVSEAVKEGYGKRIDEGRFPPYILYLEIPPHTFDVNVHPRKKEVRFADDGMLRTAIASKVREALGARYTETIQFKQFTTSQKAFSLPAMSAPEVFVQKEMAREPFFHYVGLCGQILLAQQTCDELVMIDLRKVNSHLFMDTIKNKKIMLQQLLSPLIIEKNADDAAVIEKHLSHLNEIGIQVKVFGRNTFQIEAIADFFSTDEVLDIIDELGDKEDLWRKAIRLQRKRVRTMEEAKKMVEMLLRTPPPYESVEQGAIFVKVTEQQLLKLWKE